MPSKLSEDQANAVKESFSKLIDAKTFDVQLEPMSETDAPVTITQNEFMRRMKDMNAVGGGGMMGFGDFPDHYSLIVNTNHPLIAGLTDKEEATRQQAITNLYDLARLSKNLLKGKELNDFIKRSIEKI